METDNYQLYDYARRRLRQKKHLYFHFVLLVVGSIFLFVINKWLHVGEPENWFVWAIMAWLFVFILHFIKVFISDRFMNKEWERGQIDKLVALQEKRINELKAKNLPDNPNLQ